MLNKNLCVKSTAYSKRMCIIPTSLAHQERVLWIIDCTVLFCARQRWVEHTYMYSVYVQPNSPMPLVAVFTEGLLYVRPRVSMMCTCIL